MILGRKKFQISPDLTIESVWEEYAKKPSKSSDEYHLNIHKSLQYLDPATKDGILNDLLQIETDSMRQNDRLRYIREKIIDLVDRKFSVGKKCRLANGNEDIEVRVHESADRGLEFEMADCDLQIAILRAYAKGKYGDVCREDWYAMYSYMAEIFYESMAIGKTVNSDRHFIFEGQKLQPTKENFQLCREKCLDAYAGQEFDIPTDNSNRLLKLFRKIKRKPIWRKLIS